MKEPLPTGDEQSTATNPICFGKIVGVLAAFVALTLWIVFLFFNPYRLFVRATTFMLAGRRIAHRRRLLTVVLFAFALLPGPPVHGKDLAEIPPPALKHSPGPQDPTELETFLDGLLGGLMQERHIPGAVALVVKNGAILLAKGYGFADLETRRPINPVTTLFRVASVSKLFTATAALQLVEQGKLDLQADVNQYLDRFQLKEGFGKPVTLANLLTHTGGFDDAFLGSAQSLEKTAVPLGQYLATHMPPRVMPPGDLISYSNHGIALAGYLVERASGQPFAQYIKQHILDPLGMNHSGFGLPTPPPAELAVPYEYKNGKYVPMGYDRMLMSPAGDFYTSASDMARFMLAHLQKGQLGDARILTEETAQIMHSRQFTHHPQLQGWCYGFAENRRNDVRTIGHSGDWRGFGTELVLVPEAHLGLFISTTRNHDPRFFEAILQHFFDRYFPRAETLPPPKPPGDFASRAPLFTGSYLPNRHVRGDFLKMGLYQSEFRVTADDGMLIFHFPNDFLDPLRLVEVEPLLFKAVDKDYHAYFRTDARGRVTHLFVDSFAYDKIAWYHSPQTHTVVTVLCSLLFVGTVLSLTLSTLVQWLTGGPVSSVPRSARRLGLVVSLLDAVFLVSIAIAFQTIPPYALLEAVPVWLVALCVLPFLSIPLSLGLPYLLVRSFRETGWTPLARLHYACLTLAAFLFAGWVWYWNLLDVGLFTHLFDS